MPAVFQKVLEIVRTLKVNEYKPTSRNAIIFNRFAKECETKTKNGERTLFWGSPWSLGLFLNHYSPNDAYWRSFGLL